MTTIIKTLVGVLVLLLLPWKSVAQEREFRVYHKLDGLQTDYMNFHLMQDSRGYIWGCSPLGVYRFDGHAFRIYSIHNGLPDRPILRTVEAFDGNIWALSYSGHICRFEDDTIHQFWQADSLRPLMTQGNTLTFQVDQHGTVHIPTKSRGYWTVSSSGKIRNPLQSREAIHGLGVILFDDRPPMVFGSGISKYSDSNSLSVFDSSLQLLSTFSDVRLPGAIFYLNQKVIDLKDGSFAVSAGGEIVRFNREQVLERWTDPEIVISSLSLSSEGDLMVSTDTKGILTFPQGKLFAPNRRSDFANKGEILWAMEDKQAGLWINTEADGIHYSPYKDVVLFDTTNSPIPSSELVNIQYRDSLLYLTSIDGKLMTYDGTYFKVLGNFLEGSKYTPFPGHRLFVDTLHNQILIGTRGKIHRYTPETGFYSITFPDSLRSSSFITGFGPDTTGQSNWVSSTGRILQLKGDKVVQYISNTPDLLRCMLMEPSGKQWVGSDLGLWNIENGEWVQFKSNSPLLNTRIRGLTLWKDRLWIHNAIHGFGVLENGRLDSIPHHVLPADEIYELEVWEDQLWGVSSTGVYRIHYDGPGTLKVEKRKIINDPSAGITQMTITPDYIYLACNKGLYRVNKATVFQTFDPPLVYLTGIEVNGRDTVLQAQYTFQPNQNYLSFRFSGISFHSKELNYQYRLLGIDDAWRSTQEQSVQYPSLLPGDYRFEVRAQNEAGVWSNEPAGMAVVILPPFWATWWFRSLYVLGLLGAVIYLFISLQKRNTKRFVTDRRMMELELTALRAQMNPHFTFNTITGVQHYIGKLRPDLAQDYLARFAQLMRTILEHANRDSILLEEELNALKLYLELESLRFEGRFSYQIEVDPKLDVSFERVPPMLVQPFIENAVYHGLLPKKDQGKLLIQISGKRDLLNFVVEDNGIGRAAAQLRKDASLNPPQSMGLNITRERLELLHQKLHQSSDLKISDLFNPEHQPSGTRVEFSIPYL